MRLHRLDLNLLVVLDALLTESSVGRAAKRLNLGQPAVSAALARLRDHFGDPILVPVGRTMVATPMALNLAAPVRDLLQRAQSIALHRPTFDPSVERRSFTVMTSDYTATVLMVPVQRLLTREAPHVQLTVRTVPAMMRPVAHMVSEALDQRHDDFALVPHSFSSEAHPHEPVLSDTFTCIAWTDHPHLGHRLTRKDFLQLPHAVVEFDDGRVSSIDSAYLATRGIQRKIGLRVDRFTLLPEMVVGTDLIAVVHTRLAQLYAERLPIRLMRVPVPVPPLIEVLHWQPYQSHDPAVTWFRQLLRRAADGLPALPDEDQREPKGAG